MGYTIEQINQMDCDEFTNVLGNIVEHCSVLAASVWSHRPFLDVNQLHDQFGQLIDALPSLVHEGILRSHPDLAGKLAAQGLLTSESTSEQKSAGLGTMTPLEHLTLTKNNDAYKEKFGFPFVICARENKKTAILEGISVRLENSRSVELHTGIQEVKKIGFYRLVAIIDS